MTGNHHADLSFLGNSISQCFFSSSIFIGLFSAYNPPTPPQGTGYHRYILAAFRQATALNNVRPPTQRCHFDIDQFVSENNLSIPPTAVNMFKTQSET